MSVGRPALYEWIVVGKLHGESVQTTVTAGSIQAAIEGAARLGIRDITKACMTTRSSALAPFPAPSGTDRKP